MKELAQNNQQQLTFFETVHIVLTCMIISWFNAGIILLIPGVGAMTLFGMFGIWFCMVCFFDKYFISEYVSKAKWLLIFSAMVLIFSVRNTDFWGKESYNAVYMPMIYIISIYFSKEELHYQRKIILTYFFAECILMCIRSYIVLRTDLMYVRMVTGGEDVETYKFVVSYSSVYAFLTFTIFLLNLRHYLSGYFKILAFIFIPISIIVIYMSSFGTAILLGSIFVALSIITKKKWTLLVLIICLLLAIWIFRKPISEMLVNISKTEMNQMMDMTKIKLYNSAMTLQGKKVRYNTLDGRLGYMTDAWGVFQIAPFFGIYGMSDLMVGYRYLLRDHNVWVDMLAYYGVIRLLPFVLFLISWYKETVKDKNVHYANSVFVASMFCFVCGFLNPINKYPIHIILFLIIPISYELLYSDKMESERK